MRHIALVLLILSFSATFIRGDDADPIAVAHEAAVEAIRAGEWKEAKKQISNYRKLGKKSAKKEASRLGRWSKASQTLQKIRAKYEERKLSPKPAMTAIETLTAQQVELPEFIAESRELIDRILDEFYLTLEDFEGETHPSIGKHAFAKLVDSPVRRGKKAIHWTGYPQAPNDWMIAFDSPRDFREGEAIVFWAHAERKARWSIELTVRTETMENHRATVIVPAGGWNEVRLPLRGRDAPWKAGSAATWDKVTGIEFRKDDDKGMDLTIDEICLERNPSSK